MFSLGNLDAEHNLRREELNNHIPPSHRHDYVLHEKGRIIASDTERYGQVNRTAD